MTGEQYKNRNTSTFDNHYLGSIEERVMQDTLAAKVAGTKVVGVYCAFTPKELVAAAGAMPVALCSGSGIPIPLAEHLLPRNLCALIKSSYSHAIGDSRPYIKATYLLLADATCDGKKKMFELLACKRPLHLLQLPQTAATRRVMDTGSVNSQGSKSCLNVRPAQPSPTNDCECRSASAATCAQPFTKRFA